MPELFPIAFDSGIHQDTDAAVAHEGTLARITNGRIPRAGGLAKRMPVSAISKTVEPSGVSQAFGSARPHAAALIQSRDVLALSGRVYSRDDATRPSWTEVSRPSRFIPRRSHFVALDEKQTIAKPPNVATDGSSICVVYSETETPNITGASDLYVVIELFDMGMVRRFASKLATRTAPKVFVVGSVYVITYADLDGTAGAAIFGRTLNPTTLALSAEATIVLKQGTSDSYDAAAFDSSKFLLLSRTGLALMRARFVDTAFATGANQAVACANAQTTVSRIYGTPGEGIWAAWRDTASFPAHVFALDSAMAAVTGGPTNYGGAQGVTQIGITRRNSTSVWLTLADSETWDTESEPTISVRAADTGAASVITAPLATIFRLFPASTPHDGDDNGFSMWITTLETNGSSRYSLQRFTADRSGASVNLYLMGTELTAALTSNLSIPEAPIASTGNRRFFVTMEQLGNFVNSVQLYDYEDASTRRGAWRQLIECCQAGVIAGGHLQELPSDRRNVWLYSGTTGPRGFENGFIRSPKCQVGAVAGGALTAGLYQAVAVYEYVDADGRRHQSEPSAVVSFTAGGANFTGSFRIATSAQSERDNSSSQVTPVVAVYMTAANGSTFYRIGGTAVARSSAWAAHVLFTVASNPSTSAEQLYTAGGELRNSPSPSHRFALFSHDALWLCGMWDPRMIERCKTVVPGVPPRFTLANQFRAIAPFDVSALAELDGQILVLGVDGLAVMSAEGPNNQGNPALVAPSFLSPIGLLPGGETAVVRIPMGVIFPGRRGLYVVPRGGGDPEFIGSPIQGDLARVYAVAEHHEPNDTQIPASRLVAFAITDTAGVRYVAQLDQDTLQWVSVDDLPIDVEAIGRFGAEVVYLPLDSSSGGSPIWTRSDTTRTDGDDGASISLVAESSHARPFGLLGWGYIRRVQLLVTVVSADPNFPTVITLEFARDGGAFTALTGTHTPTATGVQAYEWQLPGDQPGNSFRFRVTAAGVQAGVIMHGLTCEVDGAGGLPRLVPAKRT